DETQRGQRVGQAIAQLVVLAPGPAPLAVDDGGLVGVCGGVSGQDVHARLLYWLARGVHGGTAMVTPSGRPQAPGALNPVLRFVGFVLVLGCIYWAQAVLIPLALAMLITFLLTPAVAALQRRGVPRVVAVVGTVLVALTVVAGVGAVLGMQVMSLAEELPRYSNNIRQKIADVRSMGRDTGLKRAKETVERAASEAERQVERETPKTGPTPAAPKATPVIIERDRTKGLTDLPNTVSPWLEPLSRAGLVVLLVPFM